MWYIFAIGALCGFCIGVFAENEWNKQEKNNGN